MLGFLHHCSRDEVRCCCSDTIEIRERHSFFEIRFRVGKFFEMFVRRLVDVVNLFLFSFLVEGDRRIAARPVEVHIRVEMILIKPVDGFCVVSRDVRVSHVLANDAPILSFDEGVVIAFPRS